MVGGLPTGTTQKREKMGRLAPQVFGQPLPPGSHRQPVPGKASLPVAIPQLQALLQQSPDRQREAGGSRRGHPGHLPAAPNQVLEAAWVQGLFQAMEAPRPVMHQKTRVVLPQNGGRLGIAAMRFNQVNRDLFAQQDAEILRLRSHSPAGVIQPHHRALRQPAWQPLAGRRRQVPQPLPGPTHPATAPLQPIAQFQHPRGALVRQPHLPAGCLPDIEVWRRVESPSPGSAGSAPAAPPGSAHPPGWGSVAWLACRRRRRARGAAARWLAGRASSSCLRSRSTWARARSNCRSRDSTFRSSSFTRCEEPPPPSACIHSTVPCLFQFAPPLPKTAEPDGISPAAWVRYSISRAFSVVNKYPDSWWDGDLLTATPCELRTPSHNGVSGDSYSPDTCPDCRLSGRDRYAGQEHICRSRVIHPGAWLTAPERRRIQSRRAPSSHTEAGPRCSPLRLGSQHECGTPDESHRQPGPTGCVTRTVRTTPRPCSSTRARAACTSSPRPARRTGTPGSTWRGRAN